MMEKPGGYFVSTAIIIFAVLALSSDPHAAKYAHSPTESNDMMTLQRSASESAFSRTHRSPPSEGLVRRDVDRADDDVLALISTPSVRTLPGRSSFTTARGDSQQTRETSQSTSSSSTSRLAGSQPNQPSTTSSTGRPRHRALDKTVSQQTVLSGSSTTAFSRTAWASEDSVDSRDGRKASKKPSKCRGRLILPPSPSDEGEDKYRHPWNSRKDPPSKAQNQYREKPAGGSPSSPNNKRTYGDRGSQSSHPESPKKVNNPHRYHPHNEKFPIPGSPGKSPSPAVKSPLREDVFDFSSSDQVAPARNCMPASSRDHRLSNSNGGLAGEVTPISGRGRKPSREVLLEFPPETNSNVRPLGKAPQQPERLKEERHETSQRYPTENHQVIRAAQSVPRLDSGQNPTPTNSPDRSTRPHSVDAREAPSPKSTKGKTCDFFFLFRWGKKKDKGKSYTREEGENNRNRRQKHQRSKTDNSESVSNSRDRHGRGRHRSKSRDKRPESSSRDNQNRHHHSHSYHSDPEAHHHRHHRPSSSSTSRPLRTPTAAGQSPELQYRQYRHHHRREQQHQEQKQQQHSPDENRPPAQQYTPSRRKRERPKKQQNGRGRSGNGQASTEDGRSYVSDGTAGLRHEDLPPHPSIVKTLLRASKKAPNATITGSYQKNTFVRAPGGGDQLRRGWKRSRSESPSNLRPGSANSGSNQHLAGEPSTGEGESGEMRERSHHSASRTDLDSNFHYTVSSADLRHNHSSQGVSPGMNRSRSYPGFESHSVHYFNPEADTKVITDAEDFEYKPTDMSGPLHLSFCGCGFIGMYHLGVVSCLLQRGETFLERVERVAGASGGALMAAIMLCVPDKIEEIGEQFQSLARELRSRPLGALTPGYSFARALRLLLDEVLPEDAHHLVSRKLYISLTASASGGGGGGEGSGMEKGKKKNNILMSEFETREDLIEALVATSYIPLYAGLKMPVIHGKKYMDGGFSDNMPTFSTGRTITVSPFDGRSDIAPKAGQEAQKKAHFISLLNQDYQVNVRNMKKGAHAFFPPKRHVMQEYFDLGRYDASRFLIREGLYTIKLIHNAEKACYVSSV
ncbi:patatin-like phospholipase domain-containing protein 4 [Plakobranchus ocellatus]|uniref:Patatin-like phospholipase domain-containing protein 4 n=1 Tax=Plakobranchus ocellatus TaxID=259542 RepID=A0AAV4BUX3_9GAST|nr:patatin-like phospholipase domain-containing protein 4 [Plakobranchus ocellatus]